MRFTSSKRIVVLAIASLFAACVPQQTFKGTDVRGVEWGGDFELTAHTGKRLNASDLRGQALVLFFGYTHCPDICAPTLVKLVHALRRLEADAARVQVLFVTVDPRHDTPAQLAGFVSQFHPSFIGLTGTESEIAAVAKLYNVPFERDATKSNQMIHAGNLMVKDTQGRMRLLWRNEIEVDDIVHDLKLLLRQS
ncbi:MAG TPA: SCO family protein [Burkholderiales bacterium]|nr:SCO family protein [Burkholderiales bacterium]